MVEKKLNYNQPILSVRKYSQKPDAFLHPGSGPGPIRNPGAVPFRWERAPGQPKELIIKQQKIEAVNSDEVDSLSRTESLVSSSRSSLTGSDDQDPEPSRSFSEDPETEKKRSSEVKKEVVVSQDKGAFWYMPTFAKTCSDKNDDVGDRNEDLVGVCCVMPRSCLKSSVCVLNPVPAAMSRLTVFQPSGMQSASSSSDSEDSVKAAVKTDEVSKIKNSLWEDRKTAMGSRSRSFKTLQELLEDEDYRRRRKSGNNVGKQITALEHFPLPRSPSDSWLCRTLPSVRASNNPTFTSRFANKS